MNESDIVALLQEFLWAGLWMGAPMIGAALVVGIVVGLFQALTSIQELTLTFAPKLFVMVLVFWMCSGYMARILVRLFNDTVLSVIAGV
ncbi:MAG: flagellar biosynthetic protein FliQ [Alphaproteobacteria bacterium]|jgi:flagellar biosynthesis protein FliQ|nr:flagellar biosynthetic protein FliQ [Alphaproteobacteria bacterium]